MSMERHTLEAILKATDQNFSKTIGSAEKSVGGFSGKAVTAMKVAGAAVVAGAAAMGSALLASGLKAAANADQIDKASKRVGVSTDAYQEMDYWASQNGISQGTMERAVGRLNQRMGRAAQGNDKYTEAWAELGVEIKNSDGTMRESHDVMGETIHALSQIEDESLKSAMASEVFGTKLARDLMPALQDGSMSMEEAAKIAHEMGMVMDETAIQAGVEFTDAMDTAKRSLEGIVHQVGAAVLPILNDMLQWVISKLPQIRETFVRIFSAVQEAVETGINVIRNIIQWFNTFRSENESTFNNIRETIETVMQRSWEVIQEVWNTIKRIWDTYGADIMAAALTIFSEVYETISTFMGYAIDIIVELINYIVPFIQDQLAKISAFWNEHGEQIMEAVSTFLGFVRDFFDTTFPILLEIAKTTWDMISDAISGAIDIILGVVKVFTGLLTGDFGLLKDGLIQIWDALWSTIESIGETVTNAINNTIERVWNAIKRETGIIWEQIKEAIRTAVTQAWENVKTFFTNIHTTIQTTVQNAWNTVVTFFTNIHNTIQTSVQNAWNSVVTFFTNIHTSIQTSVQNAWNTVVTFFGNIASTIRERVTEAWNTVVRLFNQIVTAIRTRVTQAVNTVRQKFTDIVNAVRERMREAWNQVRDMTRNILRTFTNLNLFKAGRAIIQSAIDGILNMKNKIQSATEGIVKGVRNLWPFSPAKEGPLSDIHKMDFAGPIGKSIDKAERPISRSMESLAGAAKTEFETDMAALANTKFSRPAVAGVDSNLQSVVQHNHTYNEKPAVFEFNLGKRAFRGHVADISDQQNHAIQFEEVYRGG